MYSSKSIQKLSFNQYVLLLMVVIFSSCAGTQRGYFTDLPDQDVIHLPPIATDERVIEPDDFLNITITARDNEAAAFFNKGIGATGGSSGGGVGYLVDPLGNVEFPILGKVKVVGLTTVQLKDVLTKQVSVYLKEPLVDVRFTTFRISIIRPSIRAGGGGGGGMTTLPIERNTILEGLAAAGNITQAGVLSDVLLFRDYKGQRMIYKIDLRKKAVLNNPELYQLRHNDVLYIKTRPSLAYREDFGFYTGVFGFVIGLVTLGFSIAK